MGKNFTQIAFTNSVKQAQEKYGSREIYQRMDEHGPDMCKPYQREMAFEEGRDSYYNCRRKRLALCTV